MGENSYSNNSKIHSYYKNKIIKTLKMRVIYSVLIGEKVLMVMFVENLSKLVSYI